MGNRNVSRVRPQVDDTNNNIHTNIHTTIRCISYYRKGGAWCRWSTGGKKCAHEDWKKNPSNPEALAGINCNWITDEILVSQRPSSSTIESFSLINKLKVLPGITRLKI